MPSTEPTAIRELRGVTPTQFRDDILPALQPVVLRGLVADWPAVRAGRESPRAMANYLRALDAGASPETMIGPASIGGRFFYNDDMTGLNFTRRPQRVVDSLDRLLALLDVPEPESVYLGALPTPASMPGFTRDNTLPLLDSPVVPRIWICNRVTVQTHYDISHNIACVVAGRRRFTLFPPEQVANLYMGPLEYTPSGTPVSMVLFDNPDLTRYPRFAEALRHARQAELEPGDAIYIPYAWWHHVEALTPFNVLVNYWWNDAPKIGSAYGVLLHAAMSLRDLPADQRAAWKPMFDVLVFSDPEESLAHLPPAKRGLMGPPSAQRSREIREILRQTFSKPG